MKSLGWDFQTIRPYEALLLSSFFGVKIKIVIIFELGFDLLELNEKATLGITA